jgi:hypothetical protein
MRLVVVLPIARPAGSVKQPDKRALSDIAHWERFGARRP